MFLERRPGRIDTPRVSHNPIMQFFQSDHLPKDLRRVAQPVAELAIQMDAVLPGGPEKSAGLRKLLEAKDCFVRAAIERLQEARE